MNPLAEALLGFSVGLLGLLGFAGVLIYVHGALAERRTKKQKQPRPVNAIAENVNWKHERRVADRAKWDTDFWEVEHGEPLPAWAHDSLVLGQVPPPTGPPPKPPTDTIFRRKPS